MNNKKMNELRMNKKSPDEGRGRITFVYTKVHPAIKKAALSYFRTNPDIKDLSFNWGQYCSFKT